MLARAYEVDRGDGGDESGAWEGGEGGGGGGGGWLSGLSTAAPELPPDVESGSADRGVLGGSKGESAKQNKGEEDGRKGEGGRGQDEDEGDEDRDAAPHGPRCMAQRTRRPEILVRRRRNDLRPLSQGSSGSRSKRVEKKRLKRED
jgi:hypothetical protein